MKKIILSIVAFAFVSATAPVVAGPGNSGNKHKNASEHKHKNASKNRYKNKNHSDNSDKGDVVIKAPSVVLEPPKIKIK